MQYGQPRRRRQSATGSPALYHLRGRPSVLGYPQAHYVMLEFGLGDSRFAPNGTVACAGDTGLVGGSMGDPRVRRPVSDTGATIIPLAADTANPVPRRQSPRLAGVAALFLFVAVPIDMPSVAENSTLKCYDGFGNSEPCVMQASAAPVRPTVRIAAAFQQASWTATAPSQPPQQASLAASAGDQPANSTTSAPAAQRTPLKRRASANCQRNLLPCLLSSLKKKLTHIASAVVAAGQARPAREHL